jgi:hypothetical protein
MSNKRIVSLLALSAALVLSVGCASSKPKAAQQAKEIDRVIVDYKGAAIGGEIPEWVEAVVNDDFESLQAMPTFKDKDRLAVVAVERGKNLDLLKSWANNFSVQAQISRAIQNKVSAEFGGNQEGDKNSEESLNFVKELVATFSQTNVSGLKKEKDYWVKLKIRDNAKKTEEEFYEYYVLYSINAKDLQEQIDIAMGKVEAKNQVQKELKNEVKDALTKLKGEDLSSTAAN